MSYLSFDASVKIHASQRFTCSKTQKTGNGGIDGYLRHVDRGTRRQNGCETKHSNPDIDPSRTPENKSYYKDSSGIWREAKTPSDMAEAVNRRIRYAKANGARIYTGGRNDSTIVRPLVIQMDSDEITRHKDT